MELGEHTALQQPVSKPALCPEGHIVSYLNIVPCLGISGQDLAFLACPARHVEA